MYLDVYYIKTMNLGFSGIYIQFQLILYDLVMVVALIVDRDFLGLHKLKNKLLQLLQIKRYP